jgi:hypothetical protein
MITGKVGIEYLVMRLKCMILGMVGMMGWNRVVMSMMKMMGSKSMITGKMGIEYLVMGMMAGMMDMMGWKRCMIMGTMMAIMMMDKKCMMVESA